MKTSVVAALIASFLLGLVFGQIEFKRKFTVVGEFDAVRNSNTDIITDVKNVASFDIDTQSWAAEVKANDINGPVYTARYDYCGNLYIGGNFTTVNSIVTGPIAIKRKGKTAFEKLSGTTAITSEPTWSAGATIFDISTDCLNVVVDVCGPKQCDVWMTGQFVATPPSTLQNAKTTYNVIKFDAGSTSYDYVAGGIGTAANTEYVGYTIFKQLENIYVGGDFGGKNMKSTNKRNYAWSDLGSATFDKPVRSMYYKYNIGINVDEIYIGGEFSQPHPYLVKYSQKDQSYTALLNPNGPVYDVRYNYIQSILYIGGDFRLGNTARYAARLPNPSFTRWAPISDFGLAEDMQRDGGVVRGMAVCGLTSVDCTAGSVVVVGDGPSSAPSVYDNTTYSGAAFYDSKIGSFYGLGGGVSGNLRGVATTFLGSASQQSISFVLLFIAALATLLL